MVRCCRYFAADLHGSVVDLRVFDDMVQLALPEISAKLTSLQFDMELVSAQVPVPQHNSDPPTTIVIERRHRNIIILNIALSPSPNVSEPALQAIGGAAN